MSVRIKKCRETVHQNTWTRTRGVYLQLTDIKKEISLENLFPGKNTALQPAEIQYMYLKTA